MFGIKASANTLATIAGLARGANAATIYPFKKWSTAEISAYMASQYIKYNDGLQLFLKDYCVFTKERVWEAPIIGRDDQYTNMREGAPTVPTVGEISSYPQGILLDGFNKKFSWTREGMHLISLEELQEELESHFSGHLKLVSVGLQRAFFNSQTVSGRDRNGDRSQFTQYPFANGDNTRIYPPSWRGGGAFTAHSHFLGKSGVTFSGVDLDIAANTIYEHMRMTVNHMCGWGASSLLTSLPGFVPVREENVHYSDTQKYYEQGFSKETDALTLEPVFLGTYNGRKCWRVWWVPDTHIVTVVSSTATKENKPLRFRLPKNSFLAGGIGSRIPEIEGRDGGMEPGPGALQILRTGDMNSIYTAQESIWEGGIGCHNPLAVAITDTQNSIYAEPTLVLS